MRSCPSASPKMDAGSTAGARRELCCTGKLVLEPRNLRAGDPETTRAAAVLARGEAVVVPPEPVHRQSRPRAFSDRCSPHAPRRRPRHQRGRDLSRAARHVRRRRHHPGPARTGGYSLRRRGRARFGRRHGQRHHEVLVHRRRTRDRETRHRSAQRLGNRSEESREAGRKQTEVSGVREAGEPGIVGGHQQSARPQRTRARRSKRLRSSIARS